MQNTGNLNSLAERMKAKAEQEQQELEALTRQQFNALQQSLSELSKNALNTTEAAIQRQLTSLEQSVTTRCRTLSWMFARKWLQILLISLSILMGVSMGGWGLLKMAESKATRLRQEIASLTDYKDALARNTAELEARYKGVTLYRSEGKDYLLLPVGCKGQIAGMVGKQTAISLEK
ncbi:MAG: hypothetical protein LUG19_00480 [Desulfovibrio sp.]|uniref:hypothetical protein n=1 Tax=Desulfovibrio sp. TaxID=885 RepID=UPI002588B979|nr:hypothetical protein [Desulfovibrio sp.]MCD7982714.1 hypothetical protein [Desulfovibrio sp.]